MTAKPFHPRCPRPRANGFSLMEVLVAMLVLAIGLLGLASLQAQSLKFNHEAYIRSQATILAYEIMDKMRTDPTADFSAADPAAVDCTSGNADAFLDPSADMAMCMWLRDLQGDAGDGVLPRLPGGSGAITVNPVDATMFDVALTWVDREITVEADCDTLGATAIGPNPSRTWDAVGNQCLFNQVWTIRP